MDECDCLTRRVRCGNDCGEKVCMSDEDVLSFPTHVPGVFELWHKSCYFRKCEEMHAEHKRETQQAHRSARSGMN